MRYHKRQTKADQLLKAQRGYLDARMGHVWGVVLPVRCEHCGCTYPGGKRPRCPKRRRPNRWRMHFGRDQARDGKQYTPPKLDGPGIYKQLIELEQETRRAVWQVPLDDRWWKYAREARRYRRLMIAWWKLPARETTRALAGQDTATSAPSWGWATTKRNRLITKVRAGASRVVVEGGCTYTFHPNASVLQKVTEGPAMGLTVRVPLFAEAPTV